MRVGHARPLRKPCTTVVARHACPLRKPRTTAVARHARPLRKPRTTAVARHARPLRKPRTTVVARHASPAVITASQSTRSAAHTRAGNGCCGGSWLSPPPCSRYKSPPAQSAPAARPHAGQCAVPAAADRTTLPPSCPAPARAAPADC